MISKQFKIISEKVKGQDRQCIGEFYLSPEDMANLIVDCTEPDKVIQLLTKRFVYRAHDMIHEHSDHKEQAIRELKQWLNLVKG